MGGCEHRWGEKEVKEGDRAEAGAGEGSLTLLKGSTRGREWEQQHEERAGSQEAPRQRFRPRWGAEGTSLRACSYTPGPE